MIFLGRTPSMIVGRTFLEAAAAPALSWAVVEPSGLITERVERALPSKDFALDQPSAGVRYVHRTLADAELYFVFNEGGDRIVRSVTLEGRGAVQAIGV